jgi:hypothetical protein
MLCLWVHNQLGYLLYPFHGDAGALLHSQRMVRRFEDDVRPRTDGLGMYLGLEIERRHRVGGKLGGQPPEVRRFPFPVGHRPEVEHAAEVVPAQRYPDTPLEVIGKMQAVTIPKNAMTEQQRIEFAAFVGGLRPALF